MKILKTISLFILAVFTSFTSVYSTAFVYAKEYELSEEVVYDYDTSSLTDDLNFGNDLSEYGFAAKYLNNIFGADNLQDVVDGIFEFGQDIYVISFIENGYGTDKFGLYLYVYNPFNLSIVTDSDKNKVQFSVSRNENDVLSSAFSKHSLILLDKTEDNVYYKFKVDSFLLSNYAVRYYAVSGIELHINGNQNATEYTVGSVYYCRTSDGKTTISRKELSTIDLDVTHVFYRTDDSQKGKGWSNQLSACYFSLPKDYSFGNNPFGTLSEVTAVFDYYYTTPILLLNNLSVWSGFYFALGKTVGGSDWTSLDDDLAFRTPLSTYADDNVVVSYYDIGYNFSDSHYTYWFTSYNELYSRIINSLSWLICDTNADFDDKDYFLPSAYLVNYYNIYKNKFTLFETAESFYENEYSLCGFTYGENEHTYSISQDPEEGAVLDFELTFDRDGFWESLAEFLGFNQTQTVTIPPLVKVDYEDLSLTPENFSKKYFIAEHQVNELKTKLAESVPLGQEVWIFRYDCSEYYGAKAEVYDKSLSDTAFDGLVCQEPVYLDWDVLSFTFEQDPIDTETQQTKVVKTTVPVVHSPEDVFSDLTRSANDFPDDSCSCADYGTMFKWLLFFGGVFVVWFIIIKIKRLFKKGDFNGYKKEESRFRKDTKRR